MDVMVSILTTAYNHAPYIAQALDSFMMQKTDFPFEVIIHDDASTDGTADIIREYAAKYPGIIKPVFQTENQYSKGISPYDFMEPLIRGKYIAQCEGDDYWCDEYKLQKQADYMQAHPECSLCLCNSYNVDVNGNALSYVEPVEESRVFSTGEILSGNGGSFATAGIMYRRDSISGLKESGLMFGEVGDLQLLCYMALHGTVYGFQEKMACYRRFVPGSWTMRVERSKNRRDRICRCENMLLFYQRLYVLVDDCYKPIISEKMLRWEFNLYCESLDWPNMRSPRFREYFKHLSPKLKSIIFMKSHFPWAVKQFRFIRYGKEGLCREI